MSLYCLRRDTFYKDHSVVKSKSLESANGHSAECIISINNFKMIFVNSISDSFDFYDHFHKHFTALLHDNVNRDKY